MGDLTYMKLNHIKRTTLVVVLGSVLSACQTLSSLDEVVEDNTKKYQRAETMPPLAIPPDLSGSRINDDITGQQTSEIYSEYEDTAANPLAEKYDVEPETKPVLTGEGLDRRLIVTGDFASTWQTVLNFWQKQGINILRKDQRIGLMDTEADAEDGYAYRARVERSNDVGKIDIYISAAGFNNNEIRNDATMRQLAEYIGEMHQAANNTQASQPVAVVKSRPKPQRQVSKRTVAAAPSSSINVTLIDEASDHYALMVEQIFADTWRDIGLVLENDEFTIEDRERSRGVYYIHYVDPFNEAERNKGIMTKLAFWQNREEQAPEEYYYLKLIEVENETKVIILDVDQVRTSTETARRILSLVQEHLVK